MQQKTGFYILITLSFIVPLSCTRDSDEKLLNNRVNELVTAIEERSEQEIKNYLSDDFSVVKRFNKEQFFFFVRYHLKRNKNISINILNKEIKLNKSNADVTANVLLLGADNWLPTRGQKYYVESRWIKQDGDWVMSRLRWTVK